MSSGHSYRLLRPPRRCTLAWSSPTGSLLRRSSMGQTVAKQLALDDLQSQPPEMRISPQSSYAFFGDLYYYRN